MTQRIGDLVLPTKSIITVGRYVTQRVCRGTQSAQGIVGVIGRAAIPQSMAGRVAGRLRERSGSGAISTFGNEADSGTAFARLTAFAGAD